MKIGQDVYTVNNKTNAVDTWKYAGMLRTKDDLLIQLTKGKSLCFLPARCVFESKDKALAVARS